MSREICKSLLTKKKMALEKEYEASQNAPFCVLDGLYCEEQNGFEEEYLDDGDLDFLEKSDDSVTKSLLNMFVWDDDELLSLISKEKETHPCFGEEILDGFLVSRRKEALDWVFRVKTNYGFTSLTAILAMNYFDRFMTCIKFQIDKPWISQLVAVSCLSLAAKVEETRVPLLSDLQGVKVRYIFEVKTIGRMEIFILSTQQWRMHPVTPISFFDHISKRLSSACHQQLDFFRKCERLLISVIADTRFMSYIPSVLATAVMIYVIKDFRPCNEVEYQSSQMINPHMVNQDKINECYALLLEHNLSKYRKINWPYQDSPSCVYYFDDIQIECRSSK